MDMKKSKAAKAIVSMMTVAVGYPFGHGVEEVLHQNLLDPEPESVAGNV
jgi:hypothetical protein